MTSNIGDRSSRDPSHESRDHGAIAYPPATTTTDPFSLTSDDDEQHEENDDEDALVYQRASSPALLPKWAANGGANGKQSQQPQQRYRQPGNGFLPTFSSFTNPSGRHSIKIGNHTFDTPTWASGRVQLGFLGLRDTAVPRILVISLCGLLLLILGSLLGPSIWPQTLPREWSVSSKTSPLERAIGFKRPRGISVAGFIFFGRHDSGAVLDCYLQRNLVRNGGVLDEVIWAARLNGDEEQNKAASEWLDERVAAVPEYSRADSGTGIIDWHGMYDTIKNDTYYFKIDDDIVFIEDTTLPAMLQTKLENPDLWIVGSNVVNQNDKTTHHHFNLGTMYSAMPEEVDVPEEEWIKTRVPWRTSKLPKWKGWHGKQLLNQEDFRNISQRPHRYLLAPQVPLNATPVSFYNYLEDYEYWRDEGVTGQVHASFFHNLEKNELWRYKFHRFDYNGRRMGLQFILIKGDDINSVKPIAQDDEEFFTVTAPERVKRRVQVDGRGVSVHNGYRPQYENGIRRANFLSRYRDFARENICPGML